MTVAHPVAAALEPIDSITLSMRAYFARLRVPYEPDALIDLLRDRKPKSAMPIACKSLADMGAVHAVPFLKELADFPAADVKATSVLSVARLAGRKETAWLLECLAKKGTDKGYVLWALAAVSDPIALPAVLEWFKKNLRLLEKHPEKAGHGSIIFAAAYLEQQTQTPEIAELFARLRSIVGRLPGNVSSQLAHFTTTFREAPKGE
jgi:hypothetical protein